MGMNSVDIYECVSYNKGVLATIELKLEIGETIMPT